MPIWWRLLEHLVRAAASRIFWTAGSKSPMRIAMMAMTTRSSTSVNAVRRTERMTRASRGGTESGFLPKPMVALCEPDRPQRNPPVGQNQWLGREKTENSATTPVSSPASDVVHEFAVAVLGAAHSQRRLFHQHARVWGHR